MKKIVTLLSILLLVTSCSVVKMDSQDFDTIVDMFFSEKKDLFNTVFEGYKCYLPKGMVIVDKADDNIKLSYQNQYYYLYVDVISYYHKADLKYEVNKDAYYSKPFFYNGHKGYVEINKVNDKYFIELSYHYAKMQAYVMESDMKDALIYSSYVLSSLEFNDAVLETLIGENVLNYKEEKFNLSKPNVDKENYLDYLNEDIKYYERVEELPNEDNISTDTELSDIE